MWEVIEFGDSYTVPVNSPSTTTTDTTSGDAGTNKYKTARELWAAILKTFGGNEATKKRKKNLLKQQYGNFKAEGSETLDKITDLTDKLFDANNLIYHYKLALAQVESRLVEYKEKEVKYCEKIRTLEYYNESNNECIETLKKKLETLKEEKEGVDGKLAGLLKALKDIDNLIESQRTYKIKNGLGYSDVPPPPAQLYLSPKKDLSWTGIPECADDTVTAYSRPSLTVESTSGDDQNRNPSVSETVASPITPKPFINSTANMRMKGKAVKPLACWFWKPSQNLSNKGPKNNSVSVMFKKYTYIDTQGKLNDYSRHMTSNISHLSDYEPFDGGYVSFGQGGCKIIGKGTIKTGKLEFENVYFVKDLKDFKLLDDANIFLRTPRQHNMYSIDLNNIVPYRDLTCLVAKSSADECILWHRRL
nr:hypothetical protein [Tanacetum cinerariifolium]